MHTEPLDIQTIGLIEAEYGDYLVVENLRRGVWISALDGIATVLYK